MTLSVGVAWVTHFQRKGYQRLLYRRLRYAYRAPSLFMQGMLEAGDDAKLLLVDESLADTCLDPGGTCQQVDLLYLSTHGMAGAGGFELCLHMLDRSLLAGGFGDDGPAIVVLDCCDLVDLTVGGWDKTWATGKLGKELRLVLGFSTPASVTRQDSVRGTAFVDELAKSPVTDAWFAAIQNTSRVGLDQPVAIALGDSPADAQNVLDNLKIGSLPGPRSNRVPDVAWRS
jgi:hypothetical protein